MGINRFESEDFDFSEDDAFLPEDYMGDSEISDVIVPDFGRMQEGFGDKSNTAVLKQAVDIVKGSWNWHFMSFSTKIAKISQIYRVLLDLVQED